MRSYLALAALSAALLPLPAPAQGPVFPTDQLIGWTEPVSPATTGNIDLQQIDQCPAAKRVCTSVLGKPANGFAGGTAYDPRHQSVWVSDGAVLVEVKVRGCSELCKQTPTLVLGTGSVVTGLAINDKLSRLYHLEMVSGTMAIVTYDNKNCPPKAIAKCTMTIGGRDIAAGIAFDEVNQLILYTIAHFQVTGGYVNTLYVAKESSPCTPICKWQIPTQCGTAPIMGLAHDSCRREAYATDGQVTHVIAIGNILQCSLKLKACCKKQLTGDWRGLAVLPGWKVSRAGTSCLKSPCNNCPNMINRLFGGDASLGNPDFGIELASGPAGSVGICYFKAGTCGAGIPIPFLCGSVYMLPPAFALAAPLSGTPPCGGLAQIPLPIPNDAGLCGLTICEQWLVVCPTTAGTGFGLSNAVEFSIASS